MVFIRDDPAPQRLGDVVWGLCAAAYVHGSILAGQSTELSNPVEVLGDLRTLEDDTPSAIDRSGTSSNRSRFSEGLDEEIRRRPSQGNSLQDRP